jgi:hypothetical protein
MRPPHPIAPSRMVSFAPIARVAARAVKPLETRKCRRFVCIAEFVTCTDFIRHASKMLPDILEMTANGRSVI